MPRLWIFSDLHQEWPENAWDPAAHAPPDGFDVAVVPGDIHTPLTSAIDWLSDRLPGVPVVFTPGNHEFWWDRGDDRYTLADMADRGRDRAARRGIHLLMDGAVEIAGSRFVGGTLWTDLSFGAYSWAHASGTARRWMNDYRRIRRKASGAHRHILPIETLALHQASRAFIDGALAAPFDGPTVVVTHHAPHPASLWDPHADLRWCYASDLTDLIERRRPDLWVHGHIHTRTDYKVEATRIVSNPKGHVEEKSSTAFDPAMVVTVGDPP
jgi:predicted phosphohydrolase